MSNPLTTYDCQVLDKLEDEQLITNWDLLESDNSYWKAEYFRTLVAYPPKGVKSHFVYVSKDGKPVAKFLFQFLEIRLKENFGRASGEQKPDGILNKLLKKLVLPFINIKIIVNGNLLLSGSYGFKFADTLGYDEKQVVFELAIAKYKLYLKQNGMKPSGILLKDLDNPDGNLNSLLDHEKYNNFKVQPKMKFVVPKEWTTMEDYLAALKSKYRVRYRKSKKSLEDVVRKELSQEDLKKHDTEMYNLYLETVDNAGFNLFLLDKEYFLKLGERMGDKFKVFALMKGEQMVSFYTLMDNGVEYDAHYLGYSKSLNGKHKIYQNMLYFMVEDAIVSGKELLHMSRTALEIKSSVGTIPEEVQLYAKHYNGIINGLASKLLSFFVPQVDWEARNPYK